MLFLKKKNLLENKCSAILKKIYIYIIIEKLVQFQKVVLDEFVTSNKDGNLSKELVIE